MKYRQLGSTGLKVSAIGIGTWQLRGEWGKTYTQQEADEILNQARESGINLIDTAECYGDHTSEALIGNRRLYPMPLQLNMHHISTRKPGRFNSPKRKQNNPCY